MNDENKPALERSQSILLVVYLLVVITILSSAVVAATLIYRQIHINAVRQHANEYHLTTRLDLSRIASEIHTIERNGVQSLLKRDERLEADKKRRENARSIYLMRSQLKSIEAIQTKFNDSTFKEATDRLAGAIGELENVIQGTQGTAQSSALTDQSFTATELVRVRSVQLDQLHQIGFQDDSAELQRLFDSRKFIVLVSIVSVAGCAVILALVSFARRAIIRQEAVERRLAQRALQAELLHSAVTMSEDTRSYQAAVKKCVEIVCRMTDWPVGHVYWISAENQSVLQSAGVWHVDEENDFRQFCSATEKLQFAKGEGLAGHVWTSDQSLWMIDPQNDPRCVRKELFKEHGILGAFGFPLKIRGRAAAILEFFSQNTIEPDETIMLMAQSVGEQVSRVIERIEADQAKLQQQERVQEELEKAKEELVIKTRFAAVGQVSAQVAHEIRNPLGSINNAIYYLRRHRVSDPEKQSQYLDLMAGEIATCNHFINELLDLTRRRRINAEPIDLTELLECVIARIPDSGGVDFKIVCDTDPFMLHCDRDRLVQVFSNLFKNSMEAIGQNGGEVTVLAKHSDGSDKIIVSDTGPGIQSENRGSVFDMLFTTKPSGTGLGLAICKQIVEQHGGTIRVIEQESNHSAFQIDLPRIRKEAITDSTEAG